MCASAVVKLDTPCSEVVWRVLAAHSIRQFPLYFPSPASPCVITFQPESTPITVWESETNSSFSNRMIPNLLNPTGRFIQCAARFGINPLEMGGKMEVLVYPKLLGSRKSHACWKVPTFLQSVFLVQATCLWKWVWIIVVMILTGENRSTRRKSCLSVILSTKNNRRTQLGSNTALRGEKIKLIMFIRPVRTARHTPPVAVMKKSRYRYVGKWSQIVVKSYGTERCIL